MNDTTTLVVQANVRVSKGKPMNKKFNVRDFQDLRDAIAKAIAWRNEILETRAASESAAFQETHSK